MPKAHKPLHVANHALGIGDAVAGLYAAAGIAKSGMPVVYHTRHPDWLARASFPGLTITDAEPPAHAADLNADYAEQLRYGTDKARWYGMMAMGRDTRFRTQRLANSIASAPLAPARPVLDCSLQASVLDLSNYVLLAPYSARQARYWSEAHWRRLAFLINQAGYEVVAIGTKEDEQRLRQTFDKSNAYWVLDQSPEWVMAAMLEAQCVIGVDSGMIHVAGLLGVPAICIHAHLSSKFLFSTAPSVVSVAPETQCRFCHWQEDRGFNEGCVSACSALASVSPEAVMAKLNHSKFSQFRAKLDRAIERDTKRWERAGEHRVSKVGANIRVIEPDIIAYTYGPDCGLGEAALMNIAAFKGAGLTVEQRRWERSLQREANLTDPRQIYYHHWHPQPHEAGRDWQLTGFKPDGAYHIAYWAYEIEEVLPPEFIDGAKVMSEIWTPSTFCQRLFEKTGLPVDVVPHAVPVVDQLRDLPSVGNKAPFTVLYLFDAWSRFARKNPTAAIRVFQAAFPSRQDVRLVLKGHHLNSEEAAALQAACGWDSRITVMNKFLSFPELEALFASADVLLSLQRGEGFGLNLARALGCGLPVITTGWGGHLDFCKPENSGLVPYRLQAVEQEQDVFYKTGVWADPNEKAAIRMLVQTEKRVASSEPTLQVMREHGRKLIASEFSQEALNLRIARRMQAILARIKAPSVSYSSSSS